MPTVPAGANLFILSAAEIRAFRKSLRAWYLRARRDLPWRRTRDPWSILVSEVMLQQTRVAAVIPYYERFLAEFPTPAALAAAEEEKLLAMWSGLGYYSRARNLQKAARAATPFPATYEGIRAMAGVGDYTAAAVGSIAFDLPYAAVDGNVTRVLSRIACDGGKSTLAALAQELLDRRHPGDHNQAMMELGATVCVPRDPQCLLCPVAGHCRARRANRQSEFPLTKVRREPVRLERTLLLIRRDGRILMRKRAEDESRMPGFWELPEPEDVPGAKQGAPLGSFRHTITHHHYRFQVVEARAPRDTGVCEWIDQRELDALPLATTARKGLAFGMLD